MGQETHCVYFAGNVHTGKGHLGLWKQGGGQGAKGFQVLGKAVIPENRVRGLSYIYNTAGREFALHAIRFEPWHPLWP